MVRSRRNTTERSGGATRNPGLADDAAVDAPVASEQEHARRPIVKPPAKVSRSVEPGSASRGLVALRGKLGLSDQVSADDVADTAFARIAELEELLENSTGDGSPEWRDALRSSSAFATVDSL